MPTSYVGPRGHTEENKRTAQGQGSQHSISSRHTLQTANSGGCARSTIKSSAGRVPRCSDSSKNATRNSTMTNGGTQRAPCVGRTDMTYRRPRSGRNASTHGWVSKTSRRGIKAKNDGGRSHAREAWGGCWGLPTTGVYCPTVTLVGHQVGQQKCPPLLVLSDLSDLSDLFKKTIRGLEKG